MKNFSLSRFAVLWLMIGVTTIVILLFYNDLFTNWLIGDKTGVFLSAKDLLLVILSVLLIYLVVKLRERRIGSKELNFEQLFNGSPFPMYVIARNTLKFLAVNEAMTDLYGYTEDEFLQMTAYSIRPEEEKYRLKSFLDEFGDKTNETDNWLHRKKNGELFYVQITFHQVPVYGSGGYLVMIKDVDRAIRDEKKINDLLHLYETVNRATNDVIWDYNLVTDELIWMQGYFETFGYHGESSPNSFWAMKKIHPDDREVVQREFRKVLDQKEKEWSAEYRYVCADGNIKYIRDKGYVIFDAAGEPVRMIGAIQDIDKQKRFEQQLLNQNEQLKEIAWINSHQVRRPLSNILGLINLIRDVNPLNPEVTELINLLEISSKELDTAVILINRQTMDGAPEM